MNCDVDELTERLENNLCFSYAIGFSLTSPGEPSMLILQPFRRFTYITAHSPILLLYLRHSSFSNPVASPTSQLILKSCCFTYVTAHSQILLLHLRHSSFSNPYVASPTPQLILQPFFRFSYATGFSLTSPGEPSLLILQPFRQFTYVTAVASPTSQLILQPFRRFTYVTAHSPILLLLHLRHSSFSNPSFAFPTSQAFHLRHLPSRPCFLLYFLVLSVRYFVYAHCYCSVFTYSLSTRH